jgi:hypothetical protein
VCSRTWKRGSAEDYARIFGGSGRTGTTASTNCAVAAYQSSMQRSPPVRRRGSGACQDTRRFNKHCATTTSTHSVSPDSMSLSKPNPIEPPWYETRMPGGGGGVAPRGVPLSRSSTLTGRSLQATATGRNAPEPSSSRVRRPTVFVGSCRSLARFGCQRCAKRDVTGHIILADGSYRTV